MLRLIRQLHDLASVGHLLASVLQQPLSQWSFLQVRNVILAMSGMILGLETALDMRPHISAKLKSHASIIDEKMRSTAAVQTQGTSIQSTILESNAESTPAGTVSAPAAPTSDLDFSGPDTWTFELSPEHQLQLQDVLTTNWPFDFTSRGAMGLDTFDASESSVQGVYDHFWQTRTGQWGNPTFGGNHDG